MILARPMRTSLQREPQESRAVRIASAAERLGRDEQRLDRARSRTYLVFPDRASADDVMREIAVTPVVADGLAWPVLMWDEEAGAGIGTFEASDGRVTVGHHWTNAERTWIADYVAGWRTVEILDALPGDWAPKEEEGPGRR
jgi:hypothetical protein